MADVNLCCKQEIAALSSAEAKLKQAVRDREELAAAYRVAENEFREAANGLKDALRDLDRLISAVEADISAALAGEAWEEGRAADRNLIRVTDLTQPARTDVLEEALANYQQKKQEHIRNVATLGEIARMAFDNLKAAISWVEKANAEVAEASFAKNDCFLQFENGHFCTKGRPNSFGAGREGCCDDTNLATTSSQTEGTEGQTVTPGADNVTATIGGTPASTDNTGFPSFHGIIAANITAGQAFTGSPPNLNEPGNNVFAGGFSMLPSSMSISGNGVLLENRPGIAGPIVVGGGSDTLSVD